MKDFKVQIWFGSHRTDLVLSASNSAHATVLARKIYPSGRVISATQIK